MFQNRLAFYHHPRRASGKHVREMYTHLNPIFIKKLGYAGVYQFFLFLLQNIDCGYSLEPPRRGGSNVYPQYIWWAKIRKISKYLSSIHICILHGRVFVILFFAWHLTGSGTGGMLGGVLVQTWGARVTFWIFSIASFINMILFLLIQKVLKLV